VHGRGRHLNRRSLLRLETSCDKNVTRKEHKWRSGRVSMPLSGPPLNEPVGLRRLLRTGLETRADEIALVYAEGGHTLARAGPRK
jgi:hypothetical protein